MSAPEDVASYAWRVPQSSGLHLLIDSTGIKKMGEAEWKTRKHGASYRRQWRKLHIGIDSETRNIRAIEITTNATGDAPVLPDLLAQIPEDEKISSVDEDGAYDTKSAMLRLRHAGPMRSFQFAATGGHGSKMDPARLPQ